MEPRTVTEGLEFPEGPVALADGSVLCVELRRRSVVRVLPDGTVETVAIPGGSPNGLALGPDGAVYVANSGGWAFHDLGGILVPDLSLPEDHSGGRIERIELPSGRVRVLYTECGGEPLVGPNDLVFDEDGGMWFTDHGRRRGRAHLLGGLYYCTPDGGSIREVVFPLDAPNGVGLSPDGATVYVAETGTGRVWSWPVRGPGEVGSSGSLGPAGAALLHGFEGYQLLDSLAVEVAGNVCVATLVTGAISVLAPDGTLVEQVPVGDPLVTNLCFGGPDRRTAFVTCSGTGRLVSMPWPRPGLPLNFT